MFLLIFVHTREIIVKIVGYWKILLNGVKLFLKKIMFAISSMREILKKSLSHLERAIKAHCESNF